MEFSYPDELRRILKRSKFHVIQGETSKWHDNVWHGATWHHEIKIGTCGKCHLVRPSVVLVRLSGEWRRMDERLMSGLSVIDDTCHQMEKPKEDTWEPCVTPLKKDQVVDKDRERKR